MKEDINHIKSLTQIFYNKIKSNYDSIILNGNKDKRIPGNLNLTFKGLNGQPLIPKLKNTFWQNFLIPKNQ